VFVAPFPYPQIHPGEVNPFDLLLVVGVRDVEALTQIPSAMPGSVGSMAQRTKKLARNRKSTFPDNLEVSFPL